MSYMFYWICGCNNLCCICRDWRRVVFCVNAYQSTVGGFVDEIENNRCDDIMFKVYNTT